MPFTPLHDRLVEKAPGGRIDPSRIERIDKEVRRVTDGGADVALEAIGRAATQEQAFNCLRAGGRLVNWAPFCKGANIAVAKKGPTSPLFRPGKRRPLLLFGFLDLDEVLRPRHRAA